MYNIVYNICATLNNPVCKVERNIVDNGLYNVVFNVLQTLHNIVINSLYNVTCNVMHCEFWTVHYVCAKFYMYSIGRNVDLNIVKREQYSSNNCVTLYNIGRNLLCEQRCRKSGVQCLHERPATYLTLLERSAVRNEINVQKCAKDSCA